MLFDMLFEQDLQAAQKPQVLPSATLESHPRMLAFASHKRSLGKVRKILLGKCSSKKARKS